MNVHTTPLDALEIHESGYVELVGTGFEISALPVMDARFPQMMARLGHGDEIAGTRLPTTAELDALHRLSLHIEPVTLPTNAMRVEAGIVNSEAAVNAFRNANMRSFDWCEIHDEEVARRLEAAGWDGLQPVVNWGKAWTVGGGIYGWWRRGKPMIQTLSYFHKGEPRYTDYATKRHAVRAIGSSGGPPIRRGHALVGVVDAIGKAGAVLGDALELAGRVVGMGESEPEKASPGGGSMSMQIQRKTIRKGSTGPDVEAWQRIIGAHVDGVFGAGTQHLTEAWQEARGLVPDGVVGAKSWAAAGEHAAPPSMAPATSGRYPGDAPACRAALRDANARWPQRKRISDGIPGDLAHQFKPGPDGKLGTADDVPNNSDHNLGNAVDITNDPAKGCDGNVIAAAATRDPRTQYVIWSGKIWNADRASEGWRKYSGKNGHYHHVHISVKASMRADDSAWPWAPSNESIYGD